MWLCYQTWISIYINTLNPRFSGLNGAGTGPDNEKVRITQMYEKKSLFIIFNKYGRRKLGFGVRRLQITPCPFFSFFFRVRVSLTRTPWALL